MAYVTRNDWDHTSAAFSLARVLTIDEHDRAVLEPMSADLDGLALQIGPPAPVGSSVLSVQHNQRLLGSVLAAGVGFYLTSLDVVPGWSGAPVIDVSGRAVGIVVSCTGHASRNGSECLPRTGNYVDLVGLDLK